MCQNCFNTIISTSSPSYAASVLCRPPSRLSPSPESRPHLTTWVTFTRWWTKSHNLTQRPSPSSLQSLIIAKATALYSLKSSVHCHGGHLNRNATRSIVCALKRPNCDSKNGLSNGNSGVPLKLQEQDFRGSTYPSYGTMEARGSLAMMPPAVMTPVGPVDLSMVLFRNRTVFIGQYINAMVAQGVISQLVTLATIDDSADIWVYLNSYGGDPYSVFAIYDCMSWINPKVGTVCFGMTASHATLILAGGEKGMRYSMPNARIMIHQPRGACEGEAADVMRQIDETVYTKHKIDKMYAAFTGQPLDLIETYTDKDRYFSAAEAMDFGFIDGLLETSS